MLALALLLSAAVDAPAPGVTKLLVLDLDAVGVDKDVARAVDQVLLGAASIDGVVVLAQSELKVIAQVEADKAELGCDTSSCLAELAGAMGAQLVLFGTVSKLGDSTTVSLSLFDSRTSSMARDNIVVKELGVLSTELPPRVRALVEKGLGRTDAVAVAPAPAPIVEAEPPSALFMGGVICTVVGGAALVGGGGYAGINELAIQDPTGDGGTKRTAQDDGMVGLVVAGIGVAVGAAGVALMLVGGDS